jgi:hypothetical protein
MKKIFSGMLMVVSLMQLSAQDLYMPRNIRKAYDKGTRDISGAPGKNYWQNKGIYNVDVKVDAGTKMVSGKETIVYTNNSPDQLNELAIRFVNNLHKPQSPRSGRYLKISFLRAEDQIFHRKW